MGIKFDHYMSSYAHFLSLLLATFWPKFRFAIKLSVNFILSRYDSLDSN